jgi:hypothetical protein
MFIASPTSLAPVERDYPAALAQYTDAWLVTAGA